MSEFRKVKEALLKNSGTQTLSNANTQNFIKNKLTPLGTKLETIFKEQETKLGEEFDIALQKETSKKKGEELSEEEIENLSKPFVEKMQQLAVEKLAVYEQIGALSDDD